MDGELLNETKMMLQMASLGVGFLMWVCIWGDIIKNISSKAYKKMYGPGDVFKWIFYVVWIVIHITGLCCLLVWAWT